ncbi:crotonobetainyl-CoA:carnitine CoA-transferase (plasmid) [Azospirillum argentinense]|uniref:Crotonobetainyl-CoA:carnitine CoA-transferase n=1 Tax=Azospirillum argentinense TaxID=2970906 RepID=A0A060E094_9PROT|nr:crotonobetainyl-CoA--carnitine CoA-transferase [Azospirillum argentinense]AIB16673.1 crotonobetainyl-CoA:carnitine CoA-transferase [Azospirillum argentinense]EZQ02287.1 dTDP-6-deoxy-L-hexose 3-O-methyltransferase [Azospirillum argentinense]MBK3802966.1 crotonobetainyl-CoA--carnitine CoA-transferase [Azospirillum argentinense]
MADPTSLDILTFGPAGETERRRDVVGLLRDCPIPEGELLMNLGLFLTPQTLSRVLFMDFLYRQGLEMQGAVMEFGCRWGQNSSLFCALRGVYEPFNRLRKVVAFDTFAGFPSVRPEDGEQMKTGAYATTEGYEAYLDRVLAHQEQESPLSHLRKYEIVKGDVIATVPEYLQKHPETVISLAYFDLDLYEPTLACLQAIRGHITRGTVLGFDEANDPATPGETVAIREALGLDRYALRRYRYNARTSYLVIE